MNKTFRQYRANGVFVKIDWYLNKIKKQCKSEQTVLLRNTFFPGLLSVTSLFLNLTTAAKFYVILLISCFKTLTKFAFRNYISVLALFLFFVNIINNSKLISVIKQTLNYKVLISCLLT